MIDSQNLVTVSGKTTISSVKTAILLGMSSALETRNALANNYLFKGLSESQITSISALASTKEFAGGDTIVRQFAKDNDLIIILDGKARVNSFSGDLIAEATAGSVIGEMSLVDDKPRSATVLSVGGTKVVTIANNELWELMDAEPAIAKVLLLNVARILTARLRAANVALDSVVDRSG